MSAAVQGAEGPAAILRLRLLGHITKSPMTVTELASAEGKHLSHVSRALSELRALGLAETVLSEPRERKYRATDEGVALYTSLNRSPR